MFVLFGSLFRFVEHRVFALLTCAFNFASSCEFAGMFSITCFLASGRILLPSYDFQYFSSFLFISVSFWWLSALCILLPLFLLVLNIRLYLFILFYNFFFLPCVVFPFLLFQLLLSFPFTFCLPFFSSQVFKPSRWAAYSARPHPSPPVSFPIITITTITLMMDSFWFSSSSFL